MSATDSAAAPDTEAHPFGDRTRFPMNYALMQPMPGGVASMRVAQSAEGSTGTMLCSAFHKPVSKCFLFRSPAAPDGEGSRGA